MHLAYSDTSKEGNTVLVTTGDALASIPKGIGNDMREAYKSNPLYFDEHLHDHVKIAVTPSNANW